MDRLPTVEIIEIIEDKFIVEAEVYGNGIIMWLLSQGNNAKVLAPTDFLNQFIEEVKKLNKPYECN